MCLFLDQQMKHQRMTKMNTFFLRDWMMPWLILVSIKLLVCGLVITFSAFVLKIFLKYFFIIYDFKFRYREMIKVLKSNQKILTAMLSFWWSLHSMTAWYISFSLVPFCVLLFFFCFYDIHISWIIHYMFIYSNFF